MTEKKKEKDYFIDLGYVSLNKIGEELCGDKVEYSVSGDTATLVLADGMGSGVKANILATLTSKMLCTMIAEGIEIDECVSTIASTLPVCKVRGVAYSTFSVISVKTDGTGYLVEYDNPRAMLIREGKAVDLERVEHNFSGKKIYVSELFLGAKDVLIVSSDGVLHAGIGKLLNFGWDREDIKKFLNKSSEDNMSARCLSSLLAGACNDLYQGEPGDDTTVACVKIRQPLPVNIMVGPPSDAVLDKEVVADFIKGDGKKIVCGGTTSQVVSRELGRDISIDFSYEEDDIPPIAYIKGIDLVTEGVITIRKLIEKSKKYLDVKDCEIKKFVKKDGASRLADLLFEQATEVNFFVGRGINLAHKDLPIDNTMKMYLVDELAKNLKSIGKKVSIKYY